jgi:tetratricopeptide (TPR) repeat protein
VPRLPPALAYRQRLASLALAALAVLAGSGAARADETAVSPAPTTSWATAQAVERTRLGRDHAAQGDLDAALRSYLDAVSFDATYGPGYIALGEAYLARGDAREAERAFSMGIEHVTGFAEGLRARGKLRARLHRSADAIADFEAAESLRPEALDILRELTGAYIAAGALPAALAASRRRLAVAEAQGDKHAAGDARVEARALAGLVAEADPVSAGASGRGPVRRALWAAEKKRR